MKKHTWVTEEVNGGHLGVDDFWICKECGASGGPVMWDRKGPSFDPFLADGSGLQVGDDCEKAKVLIEQRRKNTP